MPVPLRVPELSRQAFLAYSYLKYPGIPPRKGQSSPAGPIHNLAEES